MASLERLGELVALELRSLATEACTVGAHYGLRGYPDCRLGGVSSTWEQKITEGLEDHLARRTDYTVDRNKTYPDYATRTFRDKHPGKRGASRMACDLKLECPGQGWVWIECKSVFECVLRPGSNYDFGRDWDGLNPNTSKSYAATATSICEARLDVAKLESLNAADAAFIGLLILGFDRDNGRELAKRPDFQALYTRLRDEGWSFTYDSWKDAYSIRAANGFQEHCWFWYRSVSTTSF